MAAYRGVFVGVTNGLPAVSTDLKTFVAGDLDEAPRGGGAEPPIGETPARRNRAKRPSSA